jgi:hypothetical protein
LDLEDFVFEGLDFAGSLGFAAALVPFLATFLIGPAGLALDRGLRMIFGMIRVY